MDVFASLLLFFQMNIIAGGFYDGLMLYTHTLNETMSAYGSRPPGNVVTTRMWNRTFHGQCATFLCDVYVHWWKTDHRKGN